VFSHRDKRSVNELLNLKTKTPVLHVSSRFAPEKGCLAFVIPLVMHPTNKNGVIAYDLSVDPTPLLTLSVEQIKERVFTRREDLAEKELERIPLKMIHTNKSPIVLPRNVMREEDAMRLKMDVKACEQHAQFFHDQPHVVAKIQAVFAQDHAHDEIDPDVALYYGGFFSEDDKRLMAQLRETSPEALATTTLPFRDERLPEMLFRYRARNYPHTLNADELVRWNEFRKNRFTIKDSANTLLQEEFFEKINELHKSDISDEKKAVLASLADYGKTITEGL
jgi:exodeoxyribonuclease-1